MRRPLAAVCLAAMIGAMPAAHTAPAPQEAAAGAPDAALLDRFLTAETAARITLLAARPDLASTATRAALNRRATDLRAAGDLDGAERVFEAMQWIGAQATVPATEATGWLGLASVRYTRGHLAAARDAAERGLAVATAAGVLPLRQQALSNLSNVLRRMGDLDGALTAAEQSLTLARELGDAIALAKVLNNLGIATADVGQSRRAIEAYAESLALKQANGAAPLDIANTLSNLGGVYGEQGDTALAIDYYRRALALLDTGDFDDALTTVHGNLGQAYAVLGDRERARQHLGAALALGERIGDATRTATALAILAGIARDERRLDDAEQLHLRALVMREGAEDRLSVVESLTEIADLHVLRGRAADGLPYAERAVAMARESGLLNQLWRAQFEAGRIDAALGRIDDARRSFEQAIQTIESLRQLAAGGARTQRQYFAERTRPYYALAALDAASGTPAATFAALVTVDRARARALTDIIATGRPAADRLTGAERDEDGRLTATMQQAVAAFSAAAADRRTSRATLATLDAAQTDARLAREAFLEAVDAKHPDFRFARGEVSELTARDLDRLVPAGTAVVTFAIDGDHAWSYTITRGSGGPVITARRLAIGAEALLALADRFATQVATRDLAFAANARALYTALFGAVDARMAGASRVIVIPDGPLWKVPFQALRTPRGRYLVEERAVSYAPSLAALAALEARQRTRAGTAPFLVALGDPDITPAASADAAHAQRGAALTRLPEAAREVRAIGQLYGARSSAVFVDRDATEGALRRDLARASVLHVATHGVLDNANPMYSHLALAPGPDAGDHATDGRLEAWEIVDVDLRADLAVLSACQTARGSTGYGEGVIGLSWALFAAGASTAVVSQWEVDSASTTSLMIAFHRRLLGQRGARPDAPAALRRAALAVLNDPIYRHPFYWAGFISVGGR